VARFAVTVEWGRCRGLVVTEERTDDVSERVDEIRMTTGELVAGRYRLTAPARDTGAHALWHAHDEVLGREVAVRLVCGPPALLSRLHAAATRAGRLVHDGVAAVYDTGAVGNCVFIVREWVPGDSLQELLAAGPLDAHMVSEVGVQLADVLAALAASGLRHQRLHLRNVIVTPNGGVKITDVETADALDDRHAPEVRWFGGILYGALTARWPYRELPAPAGMQEAVIGDDGHPRTPTRLRAGVPSLLDGVTMAALTAPAGDRPDPAAVKQLAAPLMRLPRSHPSLDSYDEPLPEAEPPRPRRQTVLVSILGGLVAVIGLLWLAARIAGPTGPIPFFQNAAPGPARAATASGAPASGAGSPAASQRPIPIAAISDYDPFGDNTEDPGRLSLINGSGSAGGWRTDGYFDPFPLLKRGVGVVVDAGRPVSPHEVTVTFGWPGTSWELRTADAPAPDFAATNAVAAGTTDAASTVTVPTGTTSRYWVVWLTQLPKTADGTYRAEIRAIVLR
jgi:putative peptidoglycan lipid II flippase